MPDKQPSWSISPTQQKSAGAPMQNMKITHDVVMSISERVYGMLLRELKVERERQRFLNGPQRK